MDFSLEGPNITRTIKSFLLDHPASSGIMVEQGDTMEKPSDLKKIILETLRECSLEVYICKGLVKVRLFDKEGNILLEGSDCLPANEEYPR